MSDDDKQRLEELQLLKNKETSVAIEVKLINDTIFGKGRMREGASARYVPSSACHVYKSSLKMMQQIILKCFQFSEIW